ncbi:MAG: SpoIIE family protein phosphatase [Lentisphaerae bacterium]|nr:SpoIIE family protein phosphatase [Lentisphaerota bacterium]
MRGCCSIRGRMMLWVLTVTGLVLIAVIIWSYANSRHRLEADMETKARFLADGAARQVDAQLGVLRGVVHGLALALETRQLNFTFAEVRALQNECVSVNPGIYGCCVALEKNSAPTGWDDLAPWAYRIDDRLAYEGLSGIECAHTREDWFALPKYLGKPVWSEPYSWNGVLMTTYSVPLYRGEGDSRRFVGVVTCDLTLDWLEQMLAALPLGKGGYAMLLSRNGTYISHPLRDFVLNETFYSIAEGRQIPILRDIGRNMMRSESDLQLFRSLVTGDISWLAHSPLHSGDWIMAAIISHDEMKASILRLTRQQAAIGLVGLLLLGLATTLISRSISRPITRLSEAADTLARGNLEAELPTLHGNDEVAHLTHAFSDMRDNLRRHIADLRETTAASERMQSELRIGRDIQMGLVPKTFPPFPERNDLDLYGVLEPAREVGGDFYDFFLLDDNRILIAIGDVSGKGVPAALFMAVTRSFLRSAFRTETDPGTALTRINRDLIEGNDSCMFVTLFCAVLNITTGELCYANAGHNPPAILHPQGHVEWITQSGGPIAGIVDSAVYTSGTSLLPREATLVLYTDGVTEAMNIDGNLYGEERLATTLTNSAPLSDCRAAINQILRDIRRFAGDAEQSDDITMLLLRRRNSTAKLELSIADTPLGQQEAIEKLDLFLDTHQIAPERQYAIRLAFEEILTNIVKYAYDEPGGHTITACLRLDTPATLTFIDDGHPFDPLTDAPAPTLKGEVAERPIGGLGLHLIQSMGMTLTYQYKDKRNILTVTLPEELNF